MIRRLSYLAMLAAVLGIAPSVLAAKNVVLLIADDLGIEQVGCYGNPIIRTPNLDALAKSGARFTQAFSSVASCSPSRGSLLTGLPTHQCGQYGLAHAAHHSQSFDNVASLPGLLGKAGYATGVIAKLHVGPKAVYPFDAELGPGAGRNPTAIERFTKQFLQQAGDKPFFLLVGYTDPHRDAKGFANKDYPDAQPIVYDPKEVIVPAHLPDRPEVRQELAEYYQSVSRLDDGVGRVLKAIQSAGKADETLVIFLSDNGIPFPGAKTTLYDAGVHLPLLIRAPGKGKPEVVNPSLVSFLDVAPTILDWAGVPAPKAMLGKSLLPLLDGSAPADRTAVYGSHQYHEVTMYYPMRMIRTRKFKLLVNLAHPLEYPSAGDLFDSPTWQGILERKDTQLGRRSLATFLHRPMLELYDVQADPNELKNLAADPAYASTVQELRAQLREWQKLTKDPWLVKDRHE
ncbi:sulfatase family protein [Tuwongella immobilis]|uniref:Sulfatase N-terminal domain-containing protein n=1 Tax=Tuwongella immobilis TaxID=692036 RepID=A0A6C2YM99_9BACT|nr:sulfatase [Tuwongella immobilis]VIP02349.1 heparan n-sulfatase : Uncharacterized protein OS=Sphingomonas sanxanigenens DSM 19645 = NX02 GN=NX02_06935 PE=4 SV=1: Sulfatase [Tuwongella immobilis]VTS01133.1 heparan n-sulfatase : Uncharacterized protein OS=Sphingomonas sanxanigenens DSM 19645 = NX02 GN=NX02_06935 PE=4 SV=1: Sulfatase [Tuwongella immobilis]